MLEISSQQIMETFLYLGFTNLLLKIDQYALLWTRFQFIKYNIYIDNNTCYIYYLYLVAGKSSIEKHREIRPPLKSFDIAGEIGDSWFSFLWARYYKPNQFVKITSQSTSLRKINSVPLTYKNGLSSPGLNREIADFKSRVGKVQGELECLVSESEDMLQD